MAGWAIALSVVGGYVAFVAVWAVVSTVLGRLRELVYEVRLARRAAEETAACVREVMRLEQRRAMQAAPTWAPRSASYPSPFDVRPGATGG